MVIRLKLGWRLSSMTEKENSIEYQQGVVVLMSDLSGWAWVRRAVLMIMWFTCVHMMLA